MTPDQLGFGQPPKREAEFQRRSRAAKKNKVENQDAYRNLRMSPLVDDILKRDWEEYRENRKTMRQQQYDTLRTIWGDNVEVPWYISPSTASHCLLWVGYEALGERLGLRPMTPPTEAIMAMMIGSAAHYSLLRKIERILPGRQETAFTIDEADLSGRLDYLFRNPVTKMHQVLELKFISDYAFRLIKRDGLPEYLRQSPEIYQPTKENRKQVLQYMWAKRKQGFDVVCANILYVNKNNGKHKEALVIWDSATEFDTEEFIDKIKTSRIKIDRGELPEPTVESPYVCATLCPWRIYCEYGQKFVAGQVKKEQKRRPKQVIALAKREAQEKRELAEKLGIVQKRLSPFESKG